MDTVNQEDRPLLVIVGPTASGKTALAIRVARRIGGEIICADSRTVYKGMDIGTAKPTLAERAQVPHYGLDIVEPDQRFSAAEFKSYANQKIHEIKERGNVPILVGGTGLYVDSVIFDYQFGNPANPSEREFLNSMSVEELQNYCFKHNIPLPENQYNKRHLVRAIEQKGVSHKCKSRPIDNTTIVGISIERSQLRSRISDRAHKMFEQTVVEEALALSKKYGWESEAMTASIYRIIQRLVQSEISLADAIELFITSDMQLAKRQMTWFRRNSFIHWSSDVNELEEYLVKFISSFPPEH